MSIARGINEFSIIVKALAQAEGVVSVAAALAEASMMPATVVRILKGAIPAGNLSDPAWAGNLGGQAVIGAFLESLRSSSIFARILADGIAKAPSQTRIVSATGGFAATAAGEGVALPLTRLNLGKNVLPRRRAAGLTVMTKELLSGSDRDSYDFVDMELRKAVSAAIDFTFADVISAGAPTIASSGTDTDAIRLDVRAALAQVNVKGAGSLFWLVTPAIANALATLNDALGAGAFTGMTPKGGDLFGCPALVSDQISDGTVILLDAGGLVGNFESITIVIARDGSVEMRDDPQSESATGTGAVLVSLWQTGLVSVRADAHFAVERMRSNAVAVIEGVNWGGSVPAS